MNLQIIKEKIHALLLSQEATLRLYPVLKLQDGTEEIKLADVNDDAATELRDMLLGYLRFKFVDNDDLYFIPLSEADDRSNAAYVYDLQEIPPTLNMLGQVLTNSARPGFSFDNDNINNITGFVILIGDVHHSITLYKRHHHLSTMKANKGFGLFKADNRFVKVKEDILKLSANVDFLQVDNTLIATNLKALEDTFGFEDVIRKQANANIELIKAMDILEDVNPLIEMANDIKLAKKILRIKTTSPVMQLPMATIVAFVSKHRPIMKKFRLSTDGTKLKLDTKVSKALFLALMNDDFLTSELTLLYYAGLSKDKMEVDIDIVQP
jgi:hypothetical protein